MNTPKLLQLSGIGDPAHLASLGIDVVRALPGVGRNYQDHFNVALEYQCEKPVSLASVFRADRLAFELLRGVFTRQGPVTQSALEAGGFFYSRPGLPAPDCQAVFIPIAGSRARVRMPWQSAKGWHSFAVALWPNRPASRGSVMIRSSSPDDDPIIQPNFLSAEQDLATTRDAVRIVRQILTAPALKQYRGAEMLPGDSVQSDDEIDAFIRAYGKSGHHASGTAKMGTDAMAVVDPQLRVHGIAGLRIADASVIPTIVTGNTNAAVIMIAEVASELISRSATATPAPVATPV
jgi:choline dehydrogenase